MSRNRKFMLGDVVRWLKPIQGVTGAATVPYFCIVVDYVQDGTGRGLYRIVRSLHPENGATFGESVWVPPHYLTKMQFPNRPTAVRVYLANEKLIDRGCECNCCAHEAIPKGLIRKDGTFTWTQQEN